MTMTRTDRTFAEHDENDSAARHDVLRDGLVQAAVAYRAAAWRFESHRRVHGLDACRGEQYEQMAQARQLMFAVVDTLVTEMLQAASESRSRSTAER